MSTPSSSTKAAAAAAPPQLTHYQVLRLRTSATDADVREAYKKCALDVHPDRPGGNATAFKMVSAAYDVLRNAQARSAYDADLKRTKRSKLFKPPPPIDGPCAQPVSAALCNGQAYTFDAAPSRAMGRFRHGDSVRWPRGRVGVIIGLAGDGNLYWSEDNVDHATLFQPFGDGRDIEIVFRMPVGGMTAPTAMMARGCSPGPSSRGAAAQQYARYAAAAAASTTTGAAADDEFARPANAASAHAGLSRATQRALSELQRDELRLRDSLRIMFYQHLLSVHRRVRAQMFASAPDVVGGPGSAAGAAAAAAPVVSTARSTVSPSMSRRASFSGGASYRAPAAAGGATPSAAPRASAAAAATPRTPASAVAARAPFSVARAGAVRPRAAADGGAASPAVNGGARRVTPTATRRPPAASVRTAAAVRPAPTPQPLRGAAANAATAATPSTSAASSVESKSPPTEAALDVASPGDDASLDGRVQSQRDHRLASADNSPGKPASPAPQGRDGSGLASWRPHSATANATASAGASVSVATPVTPRSGASLTPRRTATLFSRDPPAALNTGVGACAATNPASAMHQHHVDVASGYLSSVDLATNRACAPVPLLRRTRALDS